MLISHSLSLAGDGLSFLILCPSCSNRPKGHCLAQKCCFFPLKRGAALLDMSPSWVDILIHHGDQKQPEPGSPAGTVLPKVLTLFSDRGTWLSQNLRKPCPSTQEAGLRGRPFRNSWGWTKPGYHFFFFLAESRGQKSKTWRGKGVTTPEHLNHLMPQATAHLLVQRLEYQLLAETLLAKHSVCENLSKANSPSPKAVKLFPGPTLPGSETATWIHGLAVGRETWWVC